MSCRFDFRGIANRRKRLPDRKARHVPRADRLDGGAQQRWRTSHVGRLLGDIVDIEDHPAVAVAGAGQDVVQLVACQRPVVKLDHPEQAEIDDAGN